MERYSQAHMVNQEEEEEIKIYPEDIEIVIEENEFYLS